MNKKHIDIAEAYRFIAWASEVYPHILKEYFAVKAVEDKANEPDDRVITEQMESGG